MKATSSSRLPWGSLAAGGLLIAAASLDQAWARMAETFWPGAGTYLYPRASTLALLGEHATMVGIALTLVAILGIGGGILVTRPAGRSLAPLADAAGSLGQTIPPVAVLALSVPLLGYGPGAAVLALVLYGILPVLGGTSGGLEAVDPSVREAARGMGMGPFHLLWRVELPLAAPAILGGLRTSAAAAVGTAMVGALVGAGGLGGPLTAGLSRDQAFLAIQGLIPAILLAWALDSFLAWLETFAVES